MLDYENRIKQWIEKDKADRSHVYTGFKDADGFELAEGMVVTHAWSNEDDQRKYYVKKDVNKNKYYLQSFLENVTHLNEYFEERYECIKSRGRGIETAQIDFIIELEGNYTPIFIEYYGYSNGSLPPRHSVVNGEWKIEEVKE